MLQGRSRCCFGPPPDCAVEAQSEEKLDGRDKPTPEVQQTDTNKLVEDTNKQEEFNIALFKFHVLQELLEEEVNYGRWQRVKEVVTSTCQEVLGPTKRNHEGWIFTKTLKITKRKTIKAAVNNR